MKAITIRGIDPSVLSKLKQLAKNENKNVNQLVLDMIKQNIGMQKGKKYSKKYDDLDHLFGIWTDAEFNKIQGIIDDQRKMI
jgi:ribosomal protein S24E